MRHTVTPERETEYLDAVLGLRPGRDLAFTPELRQEVGWVRALFVEQLGWDRLRLSRYPFRALAEMARPGEWRLVRLRGPSDYAADLPEPLLALTLAEVTALPHRQRRAYIQEALLPSTLEVAEVGQGLKTRHRFSEDDRALVAQLAETHGLSISPRDERDGGSQFSAAVMALLRLAYEVK